VNEMLSLYVQRSLTRCGSDLFFEGAADVAPQREANQDVKGGTSGGKGTLRLCSILLLTSSPLSWGSLAGRAIWGGLLSL